MPRKLTTTEARAMAALRVTAGRPRGVTMPCGWRCGAKLTASQMRGHFVSCPKRPTLSERAITEHGVMAETTGDGLLAVAYTDDHMFGVRGRKRANIRLPLDSLEYGALFTDAAKEPDYTRETAKNQGVPLGAW